MRIKKNYNTIKIYEKQGRVAQKTWENRQHLYDLLQKLDKYIKIRIVN